MKTGTFLWRSHTGGIVRAPVRECPNPAVARALLEELFGTSVAWQEAPRAPRA